MFQLKTGFLLWMFLLACISLPIGCDRPAAEPGKKGVTEAKAPGSTAANSSAQAVVAGQRPAKIEVEVEIDFKDSVPGLTGKVTLEQEQTAFAALQALARQRNLQVNFKGEGETLFVMGIGEVANQGAGGINWTYRVNGELGDRSSGIFSLKPGDKVSWIFGKYP